MSNINKAFEKGKTFIGFVTGGDPSIQKSKEFILEMIKAGADLVEIGVPFSDPIAEGSVIQAANVSALKGGATIEKLFVLIEDLRKETQVPLVFLTYFNPVFHYGLNAFFKRAARAGLDGIIIPDLPYEAARMPPVTNSGVLSTKELQAKNAQGSEFLAVRKAANDHGIDLISLIAPTSEARIKEIAQNASGFIYLVSSMGVTGIRNEFTTGLDAITATIRSVTKVPVAIGFGIHTPEQAAQMAKIADGVIVGSAIVKIIAEHGEAAAKPVYDYVSSLKKAIRGL